MKNLNDFVLTNEMLRCILGGQQETGAPQFFTFNGTNAVSEANEVGPMTRGGCGCGCGCSGGAGNGNGSGTPSAALK